MKINIFSSNNLFSRHGISCGYSCWSLLPGKLIGDFRPDSFPSACFFHHSRFSGLFEAQGIRFDKKFIDARDSLESAGSAGEGERAFAIKRGAITGPFGKHFIVIFVGQHAAPMPRLIAGF